ncbi:MAG: hypothetical protein ACI4E3_12620 [Candidatus Fimousia sp.]
MNRKKVLKATAEALAEFVLERSGMIDIFLGEDSKMDLKADIGLIRHAYPFVTDVCVRGDYALMNTVLPEVRLLVYRRQIDEKGYITIVKIK